MRNGLWDSRSEAFILASAQVAGNGDTVVVAEIVGESCWCFVIPLFPLSNYTHLDALGVPEVEIATEVPSGLCRQPLEVAVRPGLAGSLGSTNKMADKVR